MVAIGQQEVYDFLTHQKGKWFTSRDISEQLNVSIGSVTMSLKKLRKTNLIKYKNTGVRNTFIYTVEPEGVTVLPPPGIIEEPEEEETRKRPTREEKIVPKVVQPRKVTPLFVRREPVAAVKKPAKPKKAKLKIKAKPAKKAKPKKTAQKKATKKAVKKQVKKAARPKPAKKAKPAKRVVKKPAKKTVKAAKRVVKVKTAKRPAKKAAAKPKSIFHRIFR